MHTVCTSIIEIAEDGKTARSSFYTPGIIFNTLNPDKTRYAEFMWERYGVDWILEDGEWRYVNNLVAEDFTCKIDCVNMAAESYRELLRTGVVVVPLMFIGVKVDIPGPSHFDYSPAQVVQIDPTWPEPYRTLEEREKYIPKPGDGEGLVKILDIPDAPPRSSASKGVRAAGCAFRREEHYLEEREQGQ